MSSSYNRTGWREAQPQRGPIEPAETPASRYERLTARACHALSAFAILYFVAQGLRAAWS